MDGSCSVPHDAFMEQEGRLMMSEDFCGRDARGLEQWAAPRHHIYIYLPRAGKEQAASQPLWAYMHNRKLRVKCMKCIRCVSGPWHKGSAEGTVTDASEQTSAALQPSPCLAPIPVFSIHHRKICLPNREG